MIDPDADFWRGMALGDEPYHVPPETPDPPTHVWRFDWPDGCDCETCRRHLPHMRREEIAP